METNGQEKAALAAQERLNNPDQDERGNGEDKQNSDQNLSDGNGPLPQGKQIDGNDDPEPTPGSIDENSDNAAPNQGNTGTPRSGLGAGTGGI
jgi:hypothetical protein